MEIFNIHIFEFLLIAGLALVVFGPERLPEVGRFVGKQVARFLAWQQQSPELRMITDVRSEFEREIASLRDELVRTRKQLDISQDMDIKSLREELRPMLNLRDPQPPKLTQAGTSPPPAELPNTSNAPLDSDGLPPETEADGSEGISETIEAAPEATLATTEVAEAGPALLVDEAAPITPEVAEAAPGAPAGTVPAALRPNKLAATTPTTVLDQPNARSNYGNTQLDALPSPASSDRATPPSSNGQLTSATEPPLTAEDIRTLMRRIEVLSADMQALISGLQAEGVIGYDWEPATAVNEQEGRAR
jgi:sec-independent protein translocase protein TatB